MASLNKIFEWLNCVLEIYSDNDDDSSSETEEDVEEVDILSNSELLENKSYEEIAKELCIYCGIFVSDMKEHTSIIHGLENPNGEC